MSRLAAGGIVCVDSDVTVLRGHPRYRGRVDHPIGSRRTRRAAIRTTPWRMVTGSNQ